ncbi:MAG: 30S ribosomal protein S27ae [Methanothrix sp.]|jgi:small subunit ribosomal protein S27Ae|nr:30S ribosomal protein S27ae [Methanothrix sp.]MCK9566899.1 30S ribosomal protein S27ae [Methanothrix sp.]
MAAKKGAKKGAVVGASRFYEVTGDSIKSKKSVCPRCGNGVFLASHADRQSCGKCGYTEFKK